MKRFLLFVVTCVIGCLAFISCNGTDTYAKSLEEEKKLISDFIKRKNIQVVTSIPADGNWGENVFVRLESGVYFHLVSKGNMDLDTLIAGDVVSTRYKAYTLEATPDSTIRWSILDNLQPESFTYKNTNESCLAFHEAVSYMKRQDSQAQLIVPSKKGFTNDMTTVTPKFYILTIRFK